MNCGVFKETKINRWTIYADKRIIKKYLDLIFDGYLAKNVITKIKRIRLYKYKLYDMYFV